MISPVPLKHSLHKEHIYISNNRSKTTLLSAIYEVMDNKPNNVYYFPAYEIIQKDNKKNYWQKDLRHLTAECITDICNHFVNMFYSNKDRFQSKAFQVREVDEYGNITKELSSDYCKAENSVCGDDLQAKSKKINGTKKNNKFNTINMLRAAKNKKNR